MAGLKKRKMAEHNKMADFMKKIENCAIWKIWRVFLGKSAGRDDDVVHAAVQAGRPDPLHGARKRRWENKLRIFAYIPYILWYTASYTSKKKDGCIIHPCQLSKWRSQKQKKMA